ncbi:MAG TPA: hypothetical protein VF658_04535 [Pyrinomonadaceae bacterium]|jgi:hypothetical protein
MSTNFLRPLFVILIAVHIMGSVAGAQQPSSKPSGQTTQAAPPVNEWTDSFDGQTLDSTKWEMFSLEGASGKVELKDGQLRLRGHSGSRTGVRSKQSFTGDRFIVEATIAKVGQAMPEPNSSVLPIGNAILTILFDGSGRNRIEWLLTSEGTFEAWAVVDGRGERLDNRTLGTKAKNPTLGIVRRGDEFLFMLNGEAGLQKVIKNLPRSFHVLLYGYGSSENNWDSARVVTIKQP